MLVALATAVLAAAPRSELVFSEQGPEDPVARVRRLRPSGPATVATIAVDPGYEPIGRVSPIGRRAAFVVRAGRRPLDGGRLVDLDLDTGAVRPLADSVLGPQAPVHSPAGDSVYALRATPSNGPLPGRAAPWTLLRYAIVKAAAGRPAVESMDPEPLVGLHLVAATPDGLIAYRVASDRAVIAIYPLERGASPRTLAALPEGALARDFSVSGRELVFASFDPATRRHGVDAIDLGTGARRRIAASSHDHPTPLATPLGLARCGDDEGLWVGGTGRLRTGGVIVPLAASPDGQIAVRVLGARNRLVVWSPAAERAVETAAHFTAWGFARAAP